MDKEGQENSAHEDVLAKLLYQQQQLSQLMREASELGVELSGDYVPARNAMVAMIRDAGNDTLADRLIVAHDAWIRALELLDRLAQEWIADPDSEEKGQRARAADDAADEAEEDFDRVMADVTAFLDEKGSH